MRKLLPALLLCATAFATAKAPEATAACEIWHIRYYYATAGGPADGTACGVRYTSCSQPVIWEGCVTAYYRDVRTQCICP